MTALPKASTLTLPSRVVFARKPLRELAFCGALLIANVLLFLGILRAGTMLERLGFTAALGVLSLQIVLALHDCMHGAVLDTPRAHRVLARILGSFWLCPYHFLRASHLAHHRHAGLVEGDTEILHFAPSETRTSRRLLAHLARTPLAPLLFAPLVQALHFIEFLRADLARDRTLLKATVGDLIGMLIVWLPLGAWLHAHGLFARGVVFGLALPYALGLSAMYLATYPLHTLMNPAPLSHLTATERHLQVSRTFDSNPLVRALFFNLNFHIEHHLHPAVSRWDLGDLARTLRPALLAHAHATQTPVAIHDSYRGWHRENRKVPVFNGPGLQRRRFCDSASCMLPPARQPDRKRHGPRDRRRVGGAEPFSSETSNGCLGP
ncbi:MAG: fatty acid desaturase, partial [Deltaproteobacteria bacterium]|nr:fatty acid desaturase [Deltaproteobacteria bacterium]